MSAEVTPAPRQLGRYALITKLASGGMGSVYLGRVKGELGFERLVAIKLVHPHLLDEKEFLARFLREARVASHIRHPHVVTVLDVGQENDTPYLVLDYVRGGSLSTLISRSRTDGDRPSVAVVSAIAREALDGLHAVHTATGDGGVPLGVIHRDISPQNILVSADGVTYVTDFGVAFAKDTALTVGSGLIGKAGYLAPEQLSREPLTAKVDLFAFGIVLWEMLTLRRLFDGIETQVAMLAPGFVVEPPSVHNADVPKALDDLVMSLLARAPERRPKDASQAVQELLHAVPPAPRSEVADWVRSHLDPDLERLDATIQRQGAAGVTPAVSKASETPPPMVGSRTDLREGATRVEGTGRRRTWLFASLGVLSGVGLVVAGGLAFGRAFLTPGPTPPAATPPAPRIESASSTRATAVLSEAPVPSTASATPRPESAPSGKVLRAAPPVAASPHKKADAAPTPSAALPTTGAGATSATAVGSGPVGPAVDDRK